MPSSSGSTAEEHDNCSQSSSGSSFLRRKPSFLKKKAPSKSPKASARGKGASGKKAAGGDSNKSSAVAVAGSSSNNSVNNPLVAERTGDLTQFLNQQQLQKINESASQPSSPTSPKQEQAILKDDTAFLRALRGSTSMDEEDDDDDVNDNNKKESAAAHDDGNGPMNDDDNAFLRNVRGDTESNNNQRSDTDNSFLATLRGNSNSSDHQPQQQQQLSNTDVDFLSAMRGTPPPSSLASVGSVDLATKEKDVNAADEIGHANAAFLGALHAASVPADDNTGGTKSYADGSFIMTSPSKLQKAKQRLASQQSYQKQHATQPQSLNSDSDFLNAVRGSQFTSSIPSSDYDSGTLVLDSLPSTNGGANPRDMDSSNAAFLMSIQASGDDNNGEINANDQALDKEGETTINESVVVEEDDIADENIEGLEIPVQPFMEKVMLPRPLFFGCKLPPRVAAEAEQAAAQYAIDLIESGNREESIALDSQADNEESTADDSSVISSRSLSSLAAGGKRIESTVAPCCRNFEGALEVFGFGVNPFVDTQHEEEKDTNEPSEPHPYVSLYTPVWDEWSTTARAKARRRKGRLLDSQAALEEEARVTQEPFSSSKRKHKKSLSMDFHFPVGNGEQPSTTVDTATSSISSLDTSKMSARPENSASDFSNDMFLQYARAADASGDSSPVSSPKESQDSTTNDFSQDQFLKYARGSGTFVGGNGTFVSSQSDSSSVVQHINSSTFVQAVKNVVDDDEIVAAEERTAVGLNDNISAAAAMLAGNTGDDDDADVTRGIDTSMFLAVGGGAMSANKCGRPYSNYELTGGCTPEYGCDDPALPHESDLGAFETKEEEKRSAERRRERNMIEDFAVPGIMPHVACPTHCSDVDDCTSYNSRCEESESGGRSNTTIISLDGNETSAHHQKSPLYEVSRIAWWNLPDSEDGSTSYAGNKASHQSSSAEVFPALDDPISLDVETNLWPSMKLLRENNMSGSRTNTATSTARSLPHLSDRPPSVRHLQIDTTAVGFPKLGGEIEPMFCKLAIYHFEMSAEKLARMDSSDSASTNDAPTPNMERCGRVTESLSFDIVQDPRVLEKCKDALWPYGTSNNKSEGTSCGMFPLPANLNISNLYAVIVVEKVMSDSDHFKAYYKPNRHEPAQEEPDLVQLRANAAKACEEYGKFTVPFAFGVVPLKHIIGDEAPKIPVSRAVQIPLFKFDPERGPQSIFDHILLMLHPRAELRGGKAASMTRGHALLVVRYFGYLGLHSILKRKSSLARDRLVDFQGELQVKCKSDDTKGSRKNNCDGKCPPVLGETYILPPWRSHYEVEPANNGGRNEGTSKSLYAQEIASLPLERSVPESSSRGRSKSTNRNKYDGTLLHTNFCNELVCQPRILQKCSKKNISIKVELREIRFNEDLGTEIVIPVASSIHNTRRGPWLVQEAFSSCAMGTPEFLDDFKIKLPLILGGLSGQNRYGLLFTVYHFKVKRKRRSILTSVPRQNEESGYYSVEELGSGLLPLALENSPTCLIANGHHDVPITYRAVRLGNEKERSPSSPNRHRKRHSFTESIGKHTRSWSTTSGNQELELSKSGDELNSDLLFTDVSYPKGSLALTHVQAPQVDNAQEDDRQSVDDDVSVLSTGGLRSALSSGDLKSLINPSQTTSVSTPESEMVLRVIVVAFTSVHPQSKTLAELFLMKPMMPRSLMPSDFTEAYAPWGKYRSEILYRLKPERIPPFMFVGGYLAETERRLLDPVVSLTKSSKCPHSDLMTHMIRIVAQLWRTAVSGAGEPSILWASPDALIPLRLNAFATLLHTVSSASHHMPKAGHRQLDGNATWDITALGRLMAMVFDEYAIFGGPLEKPFPVEPPSPRNTSMSKPEIVSGRARAKTVDISTVSSRPSIVERYSSAEESPKIGRVAKKFDVDAMLSANITKESSASIADSNDMSSLTSSEAGFVVDSKNDFLSSLRATLDSNPESSSSKDTDSMTSAKPLIAASKRRWNTLPLNALATIQESDSDDKPTTTPLSSTVAVGKVDSEIMLHPDEKKKKGRQFRVPQVKPSDTDNVDPFSSFLDSLPPPKEENEPPKAPDKQRTLPTDDGDIEAAGTAFLDRISKTMGYNSGLNEAGGEERRVGATHHRKTKSRCSIDWSLPPTNSLIEKDQRIEELNRTRSGNVPPPSPLNANGFQDNFQDSSSSDEDISGNDSIHDSGRDADNNTDNHMSDEEKTHSSRKEHPLKRHRRTLSNDEAKQKVTELPDFADRISGMTNNGSKIRWWPYVYEVIIYQWVALLDEQTKNKRSEDAKDGGGDTNIGLSPIVTKYLSHAAKAARGATIRCAPFLLEIIKQSLSWRVDCVFRERKKIKPSLAETSCKTAVVPLIKVDENLMSAVEKLITMLTDASIDSRNFDSFEYRKISIDVNTAVVRFIRDLFSILDVHEVHRLVLIYFSRFVTKEGKHWHDRDSKVTGLRCSWETTRLRLNAISLFIRFPGFMTVCSPILESFALPTGSSAATARRFYSDALEKINRLGLSELTASDGPVSKEPISIPKMKPHWLAELCTDICLSATGHAEEKIQIRASSLLFELFWRHSQQGRVKGNISVVASVYVPFLPKVLTNIEYLSNLPAKGQLRKDLLPCTIFVLQSAPTGILRAFWRKLAKRAERKSLRRNSADKYGGIVGFGSGINGNIDSSSLLPGSQINEEFEMDEEPDIFDMFGLLNLSLSTIEYEGSANQVVEENTEYDEKSSWRKEYLLSSHIKTAVDPRSRPFNYQSSHVVGEVESTEQQPNSSDSRKWHAHDCSMVIINICRQIVREILVMLKPNLAASSSEDPAEEGDWGSSYAGVTGSRSMSDIFLQPTTSSLDDTDTGVNLEDQYEEGKAARMRRRLRKQKLESLSFAVTDTIIFVRAVTSVYLHTLSMKQSDVVITKTLTAAVEIVKIFGMKVFLAAVGETLQHWMRLILEHCGARRAELRFDACEFLNLLLRLTWESYGSFSRIRLPLLAVQSEVMERIVAKSARKYVAEQRQLGFSPVLPLSNDSAEASLTPLWRTIDRLHNQSASSNLSFKSALARLAIKMKKIYRAYLAAHALALVNRAESGGNDDVVPSHPNPYVQRMRVSVHRIVSNSTWFSKRFLGNQTSVLLDRSMIQTEAVEDSFLIAADVFSSTELPSHRVAWLQKLAEFHCMRGRFAEEASCRCNIYHTYREAAKQHDHIWSSSPFLPWASNSMGGDGLHPIGEGHAIVSHFDYDEENLSGSGKQIERGAFRRIFYRSADSVAIRSGDWGAVGGGKYLFYGVALKSEVDSVSPWYSHREMEENMVEEAETSGKLYLKAGIVESSRYAWSLANQFYSETFNYAQLALVYRKLALVVTSQVPIIDSSNQLELSSQIGRFYRVHFHGGAPDDLLHSQGSDGFIYRAPNSVQIKQFASILESAIRCILPAKTTIDLQLDDGSPTQAPTGSKRQAIGGAPSEPVKIKVTPLRPLFKIKDNEKCFRGTPEWFQLKTDEQEYGIDEGSSRGSTRMGSTLSILHQRSPSVSTTNSLSSTGSITLSRRSTISSRSYRKSWTSNHKILGGLEGDTHNYDLNGVNGELVGVDRFYFTQPIEKDPVRGFRDWLKVPKGGRIAEKCLRVTELQVENSFPACITRQKIIHRTVIKQSPLEAAVEVVSTWCSVLFRTVIATNGQGVLGGQPHHQGLSADSAKLVMECIHSSGVKRIGIIFLSVNATVEEANTNNGAYSRYETLDEDEIERVQAKLARMIVTFLELLHLLIARNRDVLLAVVQTRKRRGGDASSVASGSIHGYASTPRTSTPGKRLSHRGDRSESSFNERSSSDLVGKSIIAESHMSITSDRAAVDSHKTDSAIGVQSELQRGLISLMKSLSPNLLDTLNNEVPRWMKACCQDNYFSTGLYRQADIPIGDELFFNVDTSGDDDERESKSGSSFVSRMSRPQRGVSPAGSLCSQDTVMLDRTVSAGLDRPPPGNHRRTISGASYASASVKGS